MLEICPSGLPIEWGQKRFKFLFQRMNRLVRNEDEIVTAFRDGTVTLRKNRREQGFTQSLKEIGYQGVRKGDLVVHAMDGFAGAIGVSDSDGKCTPVYSVCRPNSVLANSSYYGALLRHLAGSGFISSLAKGIRERSTEFRFSELKELLVPVPSIVTQRRIASFLDRKTAAIDELIKKKNRLIELLQEKRQALITQAVTKGLDPNVPMKESGIPWSGPYPQHWATARLSHFALVANGSTPDRERADYWEDGTIPWLSSGKVNDYVVTEADQFITPLALNECSVSLVRPGAVLVGLIGEGRTRGMSAFLDLPACINQNMAAVVPSTQLDGHFLHAVLNAAYDELRVFGRGGQQDALNCQILGSFRFPLPPLEEQRRISTQLSVRTIVVDRLVAGIRQHLTLLKEYRQALISAAVTGQLDLSKEAA